MSEATLSQAVASLAGAVSALARDDKDSATDHLMQVGALLRKASEERAQAPDEAAKAFVEGLEELSRVTARRLVEAGQLRG